MGIGMDGREGHQDWWMGHRMPWRRSGKERTLDSFEEAVEGEQRRQQRRRDKEEPGTGPELVEG